MSASLQHPIFPKKFLDVKASFLRNIGNAFLSDGAASYYLLKNGIRTRLYLYNYFALMAGKPFRAEWHVRLYSADGARSRTVSGVFEGVETVTLDVAEHVGDLGDMGLCVAHIRPLHGTLLMRTSYITIFFTEFYTASGTAFIHSFAFPISKLYQAHDSYLGSVNVTADEFILFSNSCDRLFKVPSLLKKQGPSIEIENSFGKKRRIEFKPVQPLSCQMVHLRELWPDLLDFLGGRPGIVHIEGPNVLYSPLFVEKGASGSLLMEHFQGHTWKDIPSRSAR